MMKALEGKNLKGRNKKEQKEQWILFNAQCISKNENEAVVLVNGSTYQQMMYDNMVNSKILKTNEYSRARNAE